MERVASAENFNNQHINIQSYLSAAQHNSRSAAINNGIVRPKTGLVKGNKPIHTIYNTIDTNKGSTRQKGNNMLIQNQGTTNSFEVYGNDLMVGSSSTNNLLMNNYTNKTLERPKSMSKNVQKLRKMMNDYPTAQPSQMNTLDNAYTLDSSTSKQHVSQSPGQKNARDFLHSAKQRSDFVDASTTYDLPTRPKSSCGYSGMTRASSQASKQRKQKIRSAMSASAIVRDDPKNQFSLACYKVPLRDHKYKITTTAVYKEDNPNLRKQSYMGQVMKRAKSSVCPRKYNRQHDWKQPSAYQHKFPQTKRVTMTAEAGRQKSKDPAPNHYESSKSIEFQRPKIPLGIDWQRSEDKISIIQSISYEQKGKPAMNQYNSFVGMGDMSKKLAEGVKKEPILNPPKERLWPAKVNKPDMGTYKVTEATDYARHRKTFSQAMNRDKCVRIIELITKQKAKVPAPTHYKYDNIEKGHKYKSVPPTSLRIKRH